MTELATAVSQRIDVDAVRRDFPILKREIAGKPLVYLDSAATSQKPQQVLDAVDTYYRRSNANVHRGVHTLAGEATELFENTRLRVARFIDAAPEGVVFVRNTTEALNLVAYSYAGELLQPGDRIVLTVMEHHSNLVPWQQAAARRGLQLAFLDIDDEGRVVPDPELFAPPTKLVSLSHQSNVLGTINDIAAITAMAHAAGALVCVDAAQSVPHMPVSLRELDIDFAAFSGHKMCAPMGIGVLWARPELLERMPPFLSGGSMISRVTLERTTWNEVPHKFEAGTPDVAGAVGLQAACDYLDAIGLDRIHAHEQSLARHLREMLEEVGEVTAYGIRGGAEQGGAVSFNVADVHAHDVGTILDRRGVAVRAGHHCAQPLMERLGVAATARASVYLYNTHAEIDALGEALGDVRRVFRV